MSDIIKRFTNRGVSFYVRSMGAGTYSIIDENNNEIARADVSNDGRGDYLTSIHVDNKYRRRGIASNLYDAIEDDIGAKLRPSPTYQSPDAIALWSNRLSRRR